MSALFSESYFEFFKKLAANNNKEWFDNQKKWYETDVKTPFELLVSELLQAMSELDARYKNLQPKDCIFRINRDVRFSKDKTPYKLNRSALLAPEGRKDVKGSGFYLEIGPETCGFYAGAYMPEKDNLHRIRKRIATRTKEFRDIITNKEFKKYFGEIQGEKQKRLDVEFRDAAAKEPYIFNKQFYIHHEFEEKEILGKNVVNKIMLAAEAAQPFVDFLEKK